jgi:hypothetical protein
MTAWGLGAPDMDFSSVPTSLVTNQECERGLCKEVTPTYRLMMTEHA